MACSFAVLYKMRWLTAVVSGMATILTVRDSTFVQLLLTLVVRDRDFHRCLGTIALDNDGVYAASAQAGSLGTQIDRQVARDFKVGLRMAVASIVGRLVGRDTYDLACRAGSQLATKISTSTIL